MYDQSETLFLSSGTPEGNRVKKMAFHDDGG